MFAYHLFYFCLLCSLYEDVYYYLMFQFILRVYVYVIEGLNGSK